MSKKRTIDILLVIMTVSVLARLYLGFCWRNSFFDRGNNHAIINPVAQNLISGSGFVMSSGNATIEHELLYPVFVAVCYCLFGYNWFGVVLFQSLLSALTGFLVFLFTKNIFGNRIAISSLLLTIFHPYLFVHALSVSDTTIFTFLLALMVWQTVRLADSPTTIRAFATGAIVALLILTRDSGIVLLIPLFIFLIMNIKKERLGITCVTVCIAMFIMITPWIIRNYIVSGQILLSSHGYEVIWQGNNPYSWDYISKDISVDEIPKPESIKELQRRTHIRTTETVLAERSIYIAEARQFINDRPIIFLKLMILKMVKFWSWSYNPKPMTTMYISTNLRSIVYNLYFMPVLLFGILGFIVCFYIRRKFAIFCLIMFGVFTVVHMVSVGFTRLRLPLDPILTVFASYGIFSLYCFAKRKALPVVK